MIVVADTSVILNLCRVQHEHLLKELFQRVLIPARVAAEFARLAGAQARFAGLVLPAWINVLSDPSSVPSSLIQANLDPGESAAIALCLNEKADALLIDEALGRRAAEGLGLRTIGILGVLIESRKRQLIPSVKNLLDRLEKDAGFWVSPNLRIKVLQAVEE
jgi:predicted nucleic acid-binding protein